MRPFNFDLFSKSSKKFLYQNVSKCHKGQKIEISFLKFQMPPALGLKTFKLDLNESKLKPS